MSDGGRDDVGRAWSSELEAVWGPNGTASRGADALDAHAAVDGAHELAGLDVGMPAAAEPLLVPAGRPRTRRPRLIVACVLVAAVGVAAGGFVLTAGSGRDTRTVTAAAEDEADDDVLVDDDSAANAQAFLERWKAGPSTTMPLGAAGVPLHERPTTTTTTPPAGVRGGRTPGTSNTVSSAPRTLAPSTEPRPTPTPVLASNDPRLKDAERAASDFVDAMMRRDCDAFWSALSANTIAFFDEMTNGDSQSVKDELCTSLREEQAMPAITLHPPARPYDQGAVIEIEADGDVEPLYLVLEDGAWKIDLLGGMEWDDVEGGGDNYEAGADGDLDNALVAERVHYSDYESYTDDTAALGEIEPGIEWRTGVAPADAPVGAVYVAVADGGQVVCLSARDADGIRRMVKDNAHGDGATYATGDIPAVCDATPLPDAW